MPDFKQLAEKQISKIKETLKKSGLSVSDPILNEYSYQINISQNKDKISLQIFFGKRGNKLIIQGNKELRLYRLVNELFFGENLFSEEKTEIEPKNSYIGTDESGKGDYFGPLVVAGVFVTPETGNILRLLGVKDSKELNDSQIKRLATGIGKIEGVISETILISPEKYNQLYEKMGNLNSLMGWAHAKVIENLLSRCNAIEAISDKFGNEKIILDALQEKGRQINLTQITKAEKFTAVAAASVIARDAVVNWFQYQSRKMKITIPKGASEEVENVAKKIAEKYGKESLHKIAKLHFKTSKKIFSQ